MLKPLLRDYAIGHVALFASFCVLDVWAGLDYRPHMQGAVVHIFALLFTSNRHVQRGGKQLSDGEAWQFTLGTLALTSITATAQTVLMSSTIGIGLIYLGIITLLFSRYSLLAFIQNDLRRKAAKKG